MPTNTSAATATQIASVPYAITVAPDDSAQDLWWKYTAPEDAVAIGLFAWADDAGAYRPTLHVWRGDSPGAIDDDTPLQGFEAQRKPCVLPVTPGETYYFQIEDANGTEPLGAPLEFSVLPAPAARVRAGDLFIPDDTWLGADSIGWFPASVSDPITGDVRRLARFSACEFGDVLPTGEILVQAYSDALGPHVALYNHRLELLERVDGVATANPMSIRGDGDSTFYVYDRASDTLSTVSKSGVVGGTTWTISPTARAIAPSPDGTVLYYSDGPSGGAGLKRYDLVTNISLGVIPGTAVAGYAIKEDVLVLPDGSLLAAWAKTTATVDYFIRHMTGGGTVLRTFNFGTDIIERVALGANRDSFWIYNNDALGAGGSGLSRFTHIRISDGATLHTFERYQCNAGFIEGPAVEDAIRFSHSFSCPFLILRRSETVAIDNSIPCCASTAKKAKRACRVGPTGSPSSAPLRTATGPVLPAVNALPAAGAQTPLDRPYSERLCTGGGTVPTAPDPTNGESWA